MIGCRHVISGSFCGFLLCWRLPICTFGKAGEWVGDVGGMSLRSWGWKRRRASLQREGGADGGGEAKMFTRRHGVTRRVRVVGRDRLGGDARQRCRGKFVTEQSFADAGVEEQACLRVPPQIARREYGRIMLPESARGEVDRKR